MDFLKAQWNRIQQQLGGLNSTQKMLAGALLVIMAMTVYWWSSYAGQAEMVPVFDQNIEPEQAKGIILRLKALSIPYRTGSDRIYVPADRQFEAQADLIYAQLAPQDTRSALDEMIGKISPWAPRTLTDAMLNEYRQVALRQIIQRWPGVKAAAVLIAPQRERGPNGFEPKATVNITLSSDQKGEKNRRLVETAADFISGAVAGLSRSAVTVVVNGQSHVLRDRDDLLGGVPDDWTEKVAREEQRQTEKLLKQFAYVGEGVFATVSVKVDPERSEKTVHTVDAKNKVQIPISEEEDSTESRTAPRGDGDPGVRSNAGMDLNGGVAGDNSSETTTKTRGQYAGDHGKTDVRTWKPGGETTTVAASVLIPRSYFVKAYRELNKAATTDPDPQVLDDFIVAQVKTMKTSARNCLGFTSDEMVQVDAYPDLMPTAPAVVPQAAATSVSLAVTDHAKEIALGLLALVSLVLASSIVKKGTPAPPVASSPAAPTAPPQLDTNEAPVGEAADGASLLDGMELDEESVKAQQMLGQVEQLVGEDPDAAAAMVKRWLTRS